VAATVWLSTGTGGNAEVCSARKGTSSICFVPSRFVFFVPVDSGRDERQIAACASIGYDMLEERRNGLTSVKISAKGQVTLPHHARKALSVGPGDRLLVVVEDNTVSLRPLGPSRARDLAGSLGHYARRDRDAKAARAQVKKAVAHAAAHEG